MVIWNQLVTSVHQMATKNLRTPHVRPCPQFEGAPIFCDHLCTQNFENVINLLILVTSVHQMVSKNLRTPNVPVPSILRCSTFL